jgi:virulence-associated protein VagC
MDRATAKVFVTGRSQAIRIPKEFRFDCEKETYG